MARKAIDFVFDIILKTTQYEKGNHHNGQTERDTGNGNLMDNRRKAVISWIADSFRYEIREVQEYG